MHISGLLRYVCTYLGFSGTYAHIWASQVALVLKNLSAKAGDIRDLGSIPGLGRSHGGRHSNPLQYSCLENPWMEELGGLQSTGPQKVTHD